VLRYACYLNALLGPETIRAPLVLDTLILKPHLSMLVGRETVSNKRFAKDKMYGVTAYVTSPLQRVMFSGLPVASLMMHI
jgi:hypothetical protein